MSDTVHAHVFASGRVQGVFYRQTLRVAAAQLDVAGSAVNLADGRVECHFEGSRSAVETLIEVAREGSPNARVDQLEVSWTEPVGASGFSTG